MTQALYAHMNNKTIKKKTSRNRNAYFKNFIDLGNLASKVSQEHSSTNTDTHATIHSHYLL
jgi:hypothetical protein